MTHASQARAYLEEGAEGVGLLLAVVAVPHKGAHPRPEPEALAEELPPGRVLGAHRLLRGERVEEGNESWRR